MSDITTLGDEFNNDDFNKKLREELEKNKKMNETLEEYSDDSFWEKVKNYAKDAGEAVLTPALKMYYAAQDPDTPVWAKTTVYTSLTYFIFPIDAIPDITPVIGYVDDLGTLTAAFTAVAAHIKEEHSDKAIETLKQWFG